MFEGLDGQGLAAVGGHEDADRGVFQGLGALDELEPILAGHAQVGHHDRKGQGDAAASWNSAHTTRGCSQPDLERSGGAGLLYCFAID